MKIIAMLRNSYIGSRLYCSGVQYEVNDEVAAVLIARGDGEEITEQPKE